MERVGACSPEGVDPLVPVSDGSGPALQLCKNESSAQLSCPAERQSSWIEPDDSRRTEIERAALEVDREAKFLQIPFFRLFALRNTRGWSVANTSGL